ncbi:uncharacterized protein BROUX77_003225 [Berkeleyomyces rouxiae]|uniref:uncharacterized protein n=1 Tax=Berkeleyomyces rouxiae TaxID=2035830 RepID=UPI003B7968AA
MARLAVKGCVIPLIFYGCGAYWPGNNFAKGGRLVSTRSKKHVETLDKALRVAMRSIMPVWKTSPTAALHREAAIPPALLILGDTKRKFAARAMTLDPRHPIVARLSANSETRLGRLLTTIPTRPNRPLLQPPARAERPVPQTKESFDRAAFERKCAGHNILVYSDGSISEDGSVGWGFVITQGGLYVAEGSGSLSSNHEVYDAEVIGALEGLKAAFRCAAPHLADNLYCILDNQAAYECLLPGSDPSDSSQAHVLEFQRLVSTWPYRNYWPRIIEGCAAPIWVPGHVGIEGTEKDDRLVKAEALMTPPPDLPPSVAYTKRTAKAWLKTAFSDWWAVSAPNSYRDLGLDASLKTPYELELPRRTLARLLAAPPGHGDFKLYHEKYRHLDATLHCSCGRPKDPIHLFFCWKGRRRSKALSQAPIAKTIEETLTTRKGSENSAKFLRDSNFYTDICP